MSHANFGQATELFSPIRHWADEPFGAPLIDQTDAIADAEDSLSQRYAFHLGELHGIYRLAPPDQWPSAEMEEGHAEGLKRSAKKSDIYTRKLISLRTSAWRRGLPVGSGLTAEFLQAIAVPACPVSGVMLTHGTHGDQDWSIDRLDNSLGYVPGNVCVISTRVNRLKDAWSLDALVGRISSTVTVDDELLLQEDLGNGLCALEGLRLVALMSGPTCYATRKLRPSAPFASAPSVWTTPDATIAALHVRCARSVTDFVSDALRRAWFKRLGPDTWRQSNRLVAWLGTALRAGRHPCDVWLSDQLLYALTDLTKAFMSAPPELEGVLGTPEALQLQMDSVAAVQRYTRS